jgi:hypothetical protein
MKSRFSSLGISRLTRILAKVIRARVMIAAKTLPGQDDERTAEGLPGAFQPDVMLPIQFYEAMHRKHLLEREKLLMFAVLEDAVESYMKYSDSPTKKGQKRFREAEEWIEHQDKVWLFSFDNVCEALEIDPEYLRRGLKDWKRSRQEKKSATDQHASS